MNGYLKTIALLPLAILHQACASPGLTAAAEPPKSAQQLEAETFCSARHGDGAELPPKRFTTDGCSMWPDSDWGHCCVAHDVEYWCGGTSRQRWEADQRLGQCLADNGNPKMGVVMRLGTRLGGWAVLPVPWRWGYGWYWPASGKPAAE